MNNMSVKNLRQVISGLSIGLAQLGSIDCKLVEENLMTQYMIIESDGKGILHRNYLDKSSAPIVKRCKVEYEVTSMETKHDRQVVTFGPAKLRIYEYREE